MPHPLGALEVELRRALEVLADGAATALLTQRLPALVAVAREVLIDLPATGPATALPVAGGLTAREAEIATLAAYGLSSPAIAERLFVSRRTVDNHLGAVYNKLGIDGRGRLPAALGRADVGG